MNIKDLSFEKFLAADVIASRVKSLAEEINRDYHDRSPLFLPILNGSFIFAADLIRHITLACRISFVKHTSYEGVTSTGKLKTLIGLNESIFGQDLVMVEDIMDTGLTLTKVVEELRGLGTKSVEVATLVRKATARQQAVQPKYIGFDIDSGFLVGYGLDYEGHGRHLPEIYKAV